MKVNAYLSHYIRGKKGKRATDRDMELNCQKAIVAGKVLELCIPALNIYIPGEHDEFVAMAYRKHRIDIDVVLDTDCDILDKRDLLIVYDYENFLSNGMVREINYAKKHDILIYSFNEICERTINELQEIVESIRLEKNQEDFLMSI